MDQLELAILETVKRLTPAQFERFVLTFLKRLEKSDFGEVTGKTGDEGVDGFIRLDNLGLADVFFQAKRWSNTVVGRPEVQKFVGALHGKKAKYGIFVTASSFTKDAIEYSRGIDVKIRLIDGVELVELLVKNKMKDVVKECVDGVGEQNLEQVKFENENSGDELYDEAVQIILRSKQTSTSLLQRRLKVGYSRAARLLDDMEARGLIGPADGNKPRKILAPVPADNSLEMEEELEADEKTD